MKKAAKALAEKVKAPPGYLLKWSGQYEYMEKVKAKLYVIPSLCSSSSCSFTEYRVMDQDRHRASRARLPGRHGLAAVPPRLSA